MALPNDDLSVRRLAGEAADMLNCALRQDAAADRIQVAPGRWTDTGLVDLEITGIPKRRPVLDNGVWLPRPVVVVELVRRVVQARSQRWDRQRNRVQRQNEDWWDQIRGRFEFIQSPAEFDSGWTDLIIGIRSWLMETYDGSWQTSQLKEKYGTLHFYCAPHPGNDLADEIITTAEFLSAHICECCGAPETLMSGPRMQTLCDQCKVEVGSKK